MNSYTDRFCENNKEYLFANMMGPNAMRVTEELTSYLPMRQGMRILDLACGKGLSTILLAQKYDATVFAADLWISPTDNAARFAAQGLDDRAFPFSVDVTKGLPFAQNYFDLIVCVDAYQYFGANAEMLPTLLSYLKKGGHIGVAVPGLQHEFDGVVPEPLAPFIKLEYDFHSTDWWTKLWGQSAGAELINCREMDCHDQAWGEWLQCTSPHAQEDIPMMEAEGGHYFNHVQLVAKRKE